MTETPSPHVIDADTLSGGLKPIRQVILSLGSNLGDREANLQGGVDALRDTPTSSSSTSRRSMRPSRSAARTSPART